MVFAMAYSEASKEERELVGKRLRAARQLAGKTMREVNEMLPVNRGQYEAWENGRSFPNLDYRRKLAEFFATDEETLFPEAVARRRELADFLGLTR